MATPRRSYKRDFHTALVMAICVPISESADAREWAANFIAEHDPEVLVRALS